MRVAFCLLQPNAVIGRKQVARSQNDMFFYKSYGLRIRSEFHFPELVEAGAGEDVGRDGDRTRAGEPGADRARPGWQRRWWR